MTKIIEITRSKKIALNVASILWIIWGLVHILAAFIVLTSDATGGFQAVADGVNPSLMY